MQRILLSFIYLFFFFTHVTAQGIGGKVLDKQQQPVDAVVVVLQTSDSVFLDATITGADGTFLFEKEPGHYLLYFQHVLYHSCQKEIRSAEVGIVYLEEKENLLHDVTVTAHRPQVKVEAGKLIYDTPQLISNKPVTNAFEALRELPGIVGSDDSVELVGAGTLHIVINGQLTTMTPEQLISLLKTIPASRVKSTEIMYNAPARYKVKGALINVVLDQPEGTEETFQGEAGTEYRQHHFARGSAYTNLLYTNNRFTMDLLLNGRKGHSYTKEDMFARHQLGEELIEVGQANGGDSYFNSGSLRMGLGYRLENGDKLSGVYYLEGYKSDIHRYSSTVYTYLQPDAAELAESRTDMDTRSRLQNAQIQYEGHKGVTAGVDYTHYYNPDKQHFVNHQESNSRDLLYDSRQDIHRAMLFANHTLSVAEKWRFNYGVNLSLARSHTLVDYRNREGAGYVTDEDLSLDNRQNEWGGNVFAEVARSFGKFSAEIGLKTEYFRSDYETGTQKSTLWNDWAFFPSASFSYTFHPFHILQLSVSSDKNYPSYWSVNPQISYTNSYSVIVGNPELKPGRSYEAQMVYILKQRYSFVLFTQYEPDKFVQMPYQEPDILQQAFRFENLDYRVISGVAFVAPFKAGTRLDSRLTLQGMHIRDKSDHFYDLSFKNSRLFGRVGLNNTVNLSEARPNLKLTLSGYFISPAQQGIYELGYSYDVSAGLKWLFAGDKATLTLKYDNIFGSHNPSYMRIDTGRQYSHMTLYDDSRYLGIAFSWKFGGYKEKKYKAVDDSRFGK